MVVIVDRVTAEREKIPEHILRAIVYEPCPIQRTYDRHR